ncbi:MAG TPA: AMP-binding protein [Acidimicrobiia bacterium]|jgi:acetyl-CoA synthetase
MDQPIVWRPDEERASRTHTARFMAKHGIAAYGDLYARSIEDPAWFWDAVVEYLGIPFITPYREVVDVSRGPQWATWFVGGELNLSAACVDRWAELQPDMPAVIGEREGSDSLTWSFSELKETVGRLAAGLVRLGVEPGDAVGVFLPMSPEAIAAFLATARVGGIFIPIFSGYAAEAVASRLLDPRPRVLVCADGFTRRGKLVAMKEVTDAAVAAAGGGIDHVVVVPYAGVDDVPWTEGRDVAWDEVLAADPIDPVPCDSEHPVMIAYTSGTTGRPKGSVHVHGGLTVKIAQEGAFLTDVHPGDRLMWATDMGWIMGPWMTIAALANGATAVTYDGAPDHPGPDRIWEITEKHRLTHLGLSPTLIRALQPHGAGQARRHDLSSLTAFGSTGEPLNPDPWWWLFRDVGEERVPIVNISGGTEIAAVILGVNLLQGLKPTSLGGPALGMAADVVDPSGQSVRGEVGELVLRAPWPGMTRGFWKEPDRYLATYWERFEGVWVHGDWASVDEDGFWYLHGRSDDTLNIAGKRVGPAEIESAAVGLDEVMMAAAIGVPDPIKGEAVVVYAVPSPEAAHDSKLADRVADEIVRVLGKAFRPAAVHLVDDLPRTRSAKIMRRVVRALALGDDPGDLSSLENPDSLAGIGRL